MKKVSAIIVCCLLAVALIAMPVLAAQSATTTVKADKTNVQPGDVITVTIAVSEVTKVRAGGIVIDFDTDVFTHESSRWLPSMRYLMEDGEYVEDEYGERINTFTASIVSDATKCQPYFVSLNQNGDKLATYTVAGEIFEFKLKVKDTAPAGTHTVTAQPNINAEDGEAVCTGAFVSITLACDHTWGQWTPDGANHKRECTKCGTPETAAHSFGAYTTKTPAGCDKEGEKTATCPTCGATDKKPIPATNEHKFDGAWTKVDDTNHKRTCSTCTDGTPAVETKAHTWGTASVTTPAGCDKTGEKTQTCTATGCGATKKTTIPATNEHKFDGAWTKVDGTNHKRTCSTCTDGTPAVETKAHTWGAWTETTPADCKNNGEEKRVCTANCGAFETKTIPATGNHGYQTWTKVDNEKHTAVCSGCGGFPVTKDHTWDNGTVKTPAGCDKDGEMLFTCTANGCGATKTAVISATEDHVYGAWEKVDDNEHKRTCTTCTDGTPAVETKAHTWDNGTETTPAGCDKDGVMTYTCTETTCGAKKTATIEATGNHVWGNWTSAGTESHKRTCTTCTDGTPAEQTEAHNPSADLHGDADNHWNVCFCGEKLNVTAHVYDETKWAYDAEGHFRACECGAEKAGTRAAHTEAAEGVETKKPSKTEYGEKTFYCTECQAPVRTERIDKVGNANTGDNTLVIPMVILAVLSACGLAVTVVARKRASR